MLGAPAGSAMRPIPVILLAHHFLDQGAVFGFVAVFGTAALGALLAIKPRLDAFAVDMMGDLAAPFHNRSRRWRDWRTTERHTGGDWRSPDSRQGTTN